MVSVQNRLEASPPAGSGQMFDGIAERYDLLNRLISLGIDQRWRRLTVDALQLGDNAQVLDLATGTGDLALLTARRHPTAHITGLDPSTRMMEVGMRKVTARGLTGRIEMVAGDAQELPFESDRFDGITMGFGIRNVPLRDQALREMARVTRHGGRIAILELSEPRSGLMGQVARFHMHQVVPWLGAALSGEREYRYLPQSIRAFPSADAFGELMTSCGLHVERIQPFTFGVCHLYVGRA